MLPGVDLEQLILTVGLIGLFVIVFAESGLLIGFFLPGDSLLVTAGVACYIAEWPLGWLLLLLAGSIGLPFFVLSTSASVFQHWLSRTDHPSARDPYFLYSASNLGCLLALAAYPVVVEPALTLREQARPIALGRTRGLPPAFRREARRRRRAPDCPTRTPMA